MSGIGGAASGGAGSALLGARERGNAAAKRGDWKEALDLYSQAIVADPCDCNAWCNRALAHLKLEQPLLAYGDALHAYNMGGFPPNVKALARIGMAYDGMDLYEDASRAYAACLSVTSDESLRREIRKRLEKSTEALARHEAMIAEKEARGLSLMPGAHVSGRDDEAMKRLAKSIFTSGNAILPSALRSGEGGPRHPAAVIAAFGKSLSTDWIALKDMGLKGVGIVAVREIPAGEVIHIDKPLLATSLQGERPAGVKDCYHCTRPITAESAVRCSCDRVFCSLECKATAMALCHAPLCGMAGGKAVTELEALAVTGCSASSRFILMVWKMLGCAMVHSAATGEPLMSPPDAPPFCYLARATDLVSADDRKPQHRSLALYITGIWELLRDVSSEQLLREPALSIRWVCDAVSVLGPNIIGISCNSWPAVICKGGQALMGGGNFFNHSCVYNTSYSSNSEESGPDVKFVTATPVKAGEELTIGYCNVDAPFQARQNTLLFQYGFECDCAKCKAERPATA